MRKVYVCHAYSADPKGNADKVAAICKGLVARGMLPIAPQCYLGAFIDDATERRLAMSLCFELLSMSDVLSVYADENGELSPGMVDELHFARKHDIPIVYSMERG